jgi:preprotein translocase subunit SecG
MPAKSLVMSGEMLYMARKPKGVRPMTTVLLVLHMMIAAALVAVVLLQRSEGGALGMGGGGGGFMTGRGAANLLTRITAILAAGFFGTSILLAVIAGNSSRQESILGLPGQSQGSQPAQNNGGDGSSLPALKPLTPPPAPAGPQVPQSQ